MLRNVVRAIVAIGVLWVASVVGSSSSMAATCAPGVLDPNNPAVQSCTFSGTGGAQDGFTETINGNGPGSLVVSNGSCTISGTLSGGPQTHTAGCTAPQLTAFNASGTTLVASTPSTPSATITTSVPGIFVPTVQAYYSVATLGQSTVNISNVTVNSVHSTITGIRDSIQRPTVNVSTPVTSRPNGYAWDPFLNDDDAKASDPITAALGYAKAPIYKKAPPVAVPPAVMFGIWGQTFADTERRTETFLGTDVSRRTDTYGGLGGFDAAFSNFLGFGGTWVVGVVGGATSATVKNADGSRARVDGPGVGIYTVYVNGGFSTDSLSKVDFFDLTRSAFAIPDLRLGLTNWTSTYNLNYKFNLMPSWWIEPTVGIMYTSTTWDSPSKALGFQDGRTWRVQGGARIGTSGVVNGVLIEGTLTGLAYNDVSIRGGSVAVAAGTPLVPTDEGKTFGQGIGKLNFIWTQNLSSYIEGEVRGRSNVVGYAGRLGLRYSFN